jgi:hypothetical protein
MEMFEAATRLKLRFDTPKGQVTAEDLWDLPLTSTAGRANLDDIAKGLYREVKNSAETVSFVTPVAGQDTTLGIKFDLVKHVIGVLVAERDAATEAKKKRETKQRIAEIMEAKKDEGLRGKSLEELEALYRSL